ncbi:MAG: cystathionine beta-synthase, partial [Polaribacter sp.]|nr:cystathionine beta-synthase [Polaribacter sp.]
MEDTKMLNYVKDVLENMPTDWLNLTTHRLDIYDENLAKTKFLEQFETLCNTNNSDVTALHELQTAYDYIRLGHPLSCILEWAIAHLNNIKPENVISFSSKTIPILAILRKNLLDHKNTQIVYTGELPTFFDAELLRNIYGYQFELKHIKKVADISEFNGSTIFVSQETTINANDLNSNIDFFINIYEHLGSVLLVNGEQNERYISEIQHVRRRETIAMTPANSLTALQSLVNKSPFNIPTNDLETNKKIVLDTITSITGADTKPLVGSSGLSI